jgi:fatty-acyl-CoA synthase
VINIAATLERIARRGPSTPALAVRGGRHLTYAELEERTNRLVAALVASGLGPGDAVGAWMEDGHEYFELYLAAAKAGLVIVPVNARFKAEEGRYALERARVRSVFFTDGVAPFVEEALSSRDLSLVVTTGVERVAGAMGYEALLESGSSRPVARPPLSEDSPYILAFTSGTTGYPKAAVLTHGSVIRVCRSQVMSLRIPPYGVRGHTNSMSFTSTVTAHLLPTLYVGGMSVLMGRGWSLDDLTDVVDRFRVTHTTVASPVVREFTEYVERVPERLGSLQSILHAGSKVDSDLLRRLCQAVGRRFIEGWGMTENSGGLVCATSLLDADGASPLGDGVFETVGRPVPDSDVEVVDDDGQPLPHDGTSIGELVVRSHCLAQGYWEDEAAGAMAFRHGAYHSGDMGSVDRFGYVRIADRRADLIVSGGMNVYPAEVERIIRSHEAVVDCAVVAAPHPRWGQAVVAVVVARPDNGLTDTAVTEFCKAKLASYKKPAAVVFVEQLPRNASDKVLREDLRRSVQSIFASRGSSDERDRDHRGSH